MEWEDLCLLTTDMPSTYVCKKDTCEKRMAQRNAWDEEALSFVAPPRRAHYTYDTHITESVCIRIRQLVPAQLLH